jgi:hypothetical protein
MVIAQADRRAVSRLTVLVSLVLISSGCGVLVPTPTPGPTELQPAAGTQVEVAVDNRSGESFTMTVSQGAEPGPAYLTVGPCEASNFIYPMEGPFTVGFGKAADFSDRPMPELVASDRLEIIDGGYRLLIRVAAMARWGSGPWEELRHYAAPAASYFTDGTNLTLA